MEEREPETQDVGPRDVAIGVLIGVILYILIIGLIWLLVRWAERRRGERRRHRFVPSVTPGVMVTPPTPPPRNYDLLHVATTQADRNEIDVDRHRKRVVSKGPAPPRRVTRVPASQVVVERVPDFTPDIMGETGRGNTQPVVRFFQGPQASRYAGPQDPGYSEGDEDEIDVTIRREGRRSKSSSPATLRSETQIVEIPNFSDASIAALEDEASLRSDITDDASESR